MLNIYMALYKKKLNTVSIFYYYSRQKKKTFLRGAFDWWSRSAWKCGL